MIARQPPKLPPWFPKASSRAGQAFLALLILGLCAHLAHHASPASRDDIARVKAQLARVERASCLALWANRRIPDPQAFLREHPSPTVGDLWSIERQIENCRDARRPFWPF